MTARKPGLGRSLNALLGPAASTQTLTATPTAKADLLRQIPIEFLQPGIYQPRKMMDDTALNELAESIRSQGIIQPIVVRSIANQRFEILAGERRWRAAQLAELKEVPVVIREINDEAAMAVALIENIQREDLNPIEEAQAMQRLLDEFGLTHQDLATAVGKSRTTVTNLLRLLQLREDVRRLLEHGDLEMGHARALLSLSGLQQSEVARVVVAKALTVRETERLIRLQLENAAPVKVKAKVDPNIASSERVLTEKLGALVKIQHLANGSGKLVIQYNSVDELQGILDHIQ